MKGQRRHPGLRMGFTLIEMSIVIFLLIALMSTGFFFSNAISTWKAGREGSEILRSVYVAQRTYLADNPTTPVGSLTQAKLLPYLPDKADTFPQVKGLDGTMRSIKVTVSPPVVLEAGGGIYDPSGSSSDSLWDVGE